MQVVDVDATLQQHFQKRATQSLRLAADVPFQFIDLRS